MTIDRKNLEDEIHFLIHFSVYVGYGVLVIFGYVRDWLDMLFGIRTKPPKGYAPITRDFEEFFSSSIISSY